MKAIQNTIKSKKLYKITWNVMLCSLIVATLMSGILASALIPVEFSKTYLILLFVWITTAVLSSIFYYILRILQTQKKEKKVAYYKQKNKK